MAKTIERNFIDSMGVSYSKKVLAKRIVCPKCDGEGKYVNPSIDGHGLTAEDFEDEEFKENYMSGIYDITCEKCHGENVIIVLNWDSLSKDEKNDLYRYQDACHQSEMEDYYEKKWGC